MSIEIGVNLEIIVTTEGSASVNLILRCVDSPETWRGATRSKKAQEHIILSFRNTPPFGLKLFRKVETTIGVVMARLCQIHGTSELNFS
jgi:hypothetical protein